MKVINIKVTDKLKVTSIVDGETILNANTPVKVASGNYKSIILNFEFDSTTWEEQTLTKFATFNVEGKDMIQVQLESIGNYENACYMPYSAVKQNCKVNLGVYGSLVNNGTVQKIVSAESLYLLVIDGSFSIYLTDETPVKIETIEEIVKGDIDEYVDIKKADFNENYETKINNINSNILSIEENLEETTNLEFDKYANSKRIEQSINNYFSLTPDDKIYTVRFPLWDTSNTCAGEKLDDNIGKSITPATDTIREVSNYGPAWESVDCNAEVDSNGVRHITALKGMSSFRDTGKVDVFCLFRTYWQKIWTEDGYLYISRCFVPKEGYTIVPQAINKDGTYNQWFTVGKYVVGTILDDNGTHNVYSSKGLIPAHGISNVVGNEAIAESISHTGCITLMHRKGAYYSAGLMSDYMHLLTTFYLKFATKDTQSVLCGNTKNNYQYKVAQAESNVNRVILTNDQANRFDLYSYVSVGDVGEKTNIDRGNGYMHGIAYNVKVIGKEKVDDNHTALILEHANFNTTTTTYVSTMHEVSGYSDYILGRTGSIGSNTNGKHGIVLDGVELGVGGYEVSGNAFMNIVDSTGKLEIYITNDSTKLTSNVTTAKSTYKKSSLTIQPTNLGTWNSITEYGFDMKLGLAVPTKSGQTGSGTSVGYADGFYASPDSSGQKEFLWLGALHNSTNAGLSCLNGYNGLTNTYWYILARLSINGVGGELAE